MDQRSLIIIVSYNSQSYIERCLRSIIAQNFNHWFMVVADNNSSDRTVEIVREVRNFSPQITPANFKLLRLSRNMGFSGAVNHVFFKYLKERAGEFDYLILLNPDMHLGRDAVGQLIAPLEEDRSIGVCGGLILEYGSNRVQHLGGTVTANFITAHAGSGIDYGQLKEELKGNADELMETIRDVTYTTGAFFAARAGLFSSLGGLDTGYRPAYFEELDFCLKTLRAGMRVVVNPLARARHAEAVSTTRYSRKFYKLYHKNRIRCALLHAGLFRLKFLREELKWVKNQATRDQYGPLAFAYGANLLFLPLSMAVRAKNHFILNKLQLK
ncbi:MAG: glycosyltransferase [Actinomycetota bacterium]